MADETPQPPSRSQADKDKSKQQSRPVTGQKPKSAGGASKSQRSSNGSGKAPTNPRKAAQAQAAKKASGPPKKGGNRPSGRPAPRDRRSPTALLTWGAVALVLIIVVVLVVIKATGGNSTVPPGPTAFTPAPASVVQDVTNIPASVYNTVGINSPVTSVTPPTLIKGQTPLTYDGKPGVFYLGGEYCPYCAAERWPLIAALSRFGTFSSLGEMESSGQDVYANTQTFTFVKAKFESPYVTFRPVEHFSNVPAASGSGYTVLTPLTAEEVALVNKYSTATYLGSSAQPGAIPFIDYGNKALSSGASYSPSILSGFSREQIAGGLSDPTNPVTQTIVATANYITATICATTGQQPGSVCTSKGVTDASKAMGLSS